MLKPIMRIRSVYGKYKIEIKYLLFGGITFILSLLVYIALVRGNGIDELIANVVSWLCGATFSFFASKKYVFENNKWDERTVLKQLIEYYGVRIGILVLQEVLLYVLIDLAGGDNIVAKIITEIMVIILNYLVSRFVIFMR